MNYNLTASEYEDEIAVLEERVANLRAQAAIMQGAFEQKQRLVNRLWREAVRLRKVEQPELDLLAVQDQLRKDMRADSAAPASSAAECDTSPQPGSD